MDLTDLLAATKDVNAAITQIDQKLRKPSSTPAPVVEQASTDAKEELGDVAHVSSHGYVASHRCLAVARPSNSVELVDLDGGASTVLMEAPAAAAVAACDFPGKEVLVVAAWGDVRAVAPRARRDVTGASGGRPARASPRRGRSWSRQQPYIARCAGVVDVLDYDSLASHPAVGGVVGLAWVFGDTLAVAGAGGLTIWGGHGSEPETLIPTPCRCVAATGDVGVEDTLVCVADAGLLTREEARADDMKARASDGYVGRAETRDTGFGGGLIPAGLLVAAAAARRLGGPAPAISRIDYDGRVAATARIDALPRAWPSSTPWPRWAAPPWQALTRSAVAVFAARTRAAARGPPGGGDGRVRPWPRTASPRRRGRRARRGAALRGRRPRAPGAARRVVVDLAAPAARAPHRPHRPHRRRRRLPSRTGSRRSHISARPARSRRRSSRAPRRSSSGYRLHK